MKRTNEEITSEILRRVEKLDRRDRKRRKRWKNAVFSFVFLLVAAVLFFIPWGMGEHEAPVAAVQAELLYNAAGGYVLTGVICFAAGAAATLFCLKKGGRSSSNDGGRGENE